MAEDLGRSYAEAAREVARERREKELEELRMQGGEADSLEGSITTCNNGHYGAPDEVLVDGENLADWLLDRGLEGRRVSITVMALES